MEPPFVLIHVMWHLIDDESGLEVRSGIGFSEFHARRGFNTGVEQGRTHSAGGERLEVPEIGWEILYGPVYVIVWVLAGFLGTRWLEVQR